MLLLDRLILDVLPKDVVPIPSLHRALWFTLTFANWYDNSHSCISVKTMSYPCFYCSAVQTSVTNSFSTLSLGLVWNQHLLLYFWRIHIQNHSSTMVCLDICSPSIIKIDNLLIIVDLLLLQELWKVHSFRR